MTSISLSFSPQHQCEWHLQLLRTKEILLDACFISGRIQSKFTLNTNRLCQRVPFPITSPEASTSTVSKRHRLLFLSHN